MTTPPQGAQGTPRTEACEVPLTERLRAIPPTHKVSIPFQWASDGTETGHHSIPVGALMHRAASELAACRAALEELLHVFTDLPAARNYNPLVQQARAALGRK